MDPAVILLDFRALLEATPDGIAVVDAQGRILVVNEQLCNLFGYTATELVGSRVDTLVPTRIRDVHASYREHYRTDPSRRPMGLGIDLVGLRNDGTEFPVEISLSPVSSGIHTFTVAVVRDLSDRRQLQAEQETLRTLLDTEQERHRIGMDLHDGIMQDIYAVTLGLDLAYEDVDQDAAQAKTQVGRSIDQLHNVIRDIRSYIFDLRPRQYAGDIEQALTDLGQEFQVNSSIQTRVHVASDLPKIEHDVDLAFCVITNEALSNTRKNAHASDVSTSLVADGDPVQLEIRDNGRGFDASTEQTETHRGLRNMASRASIVGANFRIESAPGHGTAVQVFLRLT